MGDGSAPGRVLLVQHAEKGRGADPGLTRRGVRQATTSRRRSPTSPAPGASGSGRSTPASAAAPAGPPPR
ncbi:hypothetical protein AB2L27_11730 [Kineococcus sp. LSe6-4]|uniref:Histidine phosphatase family protein n=1 Tax=Kineococcus halophytocola TaxID=3234027 RepID=A0ABV4H1J3_9ACTN